ncbi:MAG: hypothetical protein MSG64_20450 [Pyrinomonadaceae bacterium MAG19_C2-C3]|nr:hypothetical protein [Pyrinomonadaceae bacterium MAG19_C2-C3]
MSANSNHQRHDEAHGEESSEEGREELSLILYHRTTAERAESIITDGFRDSTGHYLSDSIHTGVWLSDVPLDANEGAKGRTLLEVTINLSEDELTPYEWIEEEKPYREWLAPAALINSQMRVVIIDEDS